MRPRRRPPPPLGGGGRGTPAKAKTESSGWRRRGHRTRPGGSVLSPPALSSVRRGQRQCARGLQHLIVMINWSPWVGVGALLFLALTSVRAEDSSQGKALMSSLHSPIPRGKFEIVYHTYASRCCANVNTTAKISFPNLAKYVTASKARSKQLGIRHFYFWPCDFFSNFQRYLNMNRAIAPYNAFFVLLSDAQTGFIWGTWCQVSRVLLIFSKRSVSRFTLQIDSKICIFVI